MNYLVRVRRKNKHISRSILSVFLLLFLTAGAIRMPAAAADTEAVFEEEPESAEKGHIFVRAVVEKGHETEIAVDLFAGFEGGGFHHYVLGPENCYGVSDDIAAGEYICSPYIAGSREPGGTSKIYVEYGGSEQTVTQDRATCFLVVAGSREFVDDYIWLSEFQDENGSYVNGVMSREDAEKILIKTIAMQYLEEEEQEDTHVPDNELTAGRGSSEEAAPEAASPRPVEDGNSAFAQGSFMPGAGAAAAVFIIAALLIVIIKKQGFKNRREFHD